MEPDKTKLNISGIVSVFGVLFWLGGWWLTHSYVFTGVALMILGLNLIYFSHDTALERSIKFKISYKFGRLGYVVIGSVFILIGVYWLIQGIQSW